MIGDAKCVESNGTNATGLPVNKILDQIAAHMNLQAHNGVSDSKDTGYDSDVAAQITGQRIDTPRKVFKGPMINAAARKMTPTMPSQCCFDAELADLAGPGKLLTRCPWR
jgi:hypothetical protein